MARTVGSHGSLDFADPARDQSPGGAKSVENPLVDLLILFRVVINLFILHDFLPTNTV